MGVASVGQYVTGLLNGLAFPDGMTGVDPLTAFFVPPSQDQQGTTQPTCWIWVATFDESRGEGKLRTGSIPRAAYPGAGSGTKGTVYPIEIYMLYAMSNTDPDSNTLFGGMLDAICATLRVTTIPVVITDPWTSAQTTVVDIGESMRGAIAVRALEDGGMNEFSALITVSVTEEFSA